MNPDRDRFLAEANVSRETMAAFDLYAALLEKWNPTINLVSAASLPSLWTRHFLDSAQLYEKVGLSSGLWVDLGSGGGFPGLICAILARERAPDLRFTLVESDSRKVVFLQTVAREIPLPIEILRKRIEDIPSLQADVLTARALAPLKVLLSYAEQHLKPGGRALFHKGASFRSEVEEALESWTFQSDEYPSSTDGAGIVLSLKDIRRV